VKLVGLLVIISYERYRALRNNISECVCSYNSCRDMAIVYCKGFWSLCDNIITVAMVMFLKEAFNFYTLLCANNALIQKTVHSSTAHVHVGPQNTAKHMFTC
jgi:hypothetical protein